MKKQRGYSTKVYRKDNFFLDVPVDFSVKVLNSNHQTINHEQRRVGNHLYLKHDFAENDYYIYLMNSNRSLPGQDQVTVAPASLKGQLNIDVTQSPQSFTEVPGNDPQKLHYYYLLTLFESSGDGIEEQIIFHKDTDRKLSDLLLEDEEAKSRIKLYRINDEHYFKLIAKEARVWRY